jgi:flagellar basal-body rod protein FlgB
MIDKIFNSPTQTMLSYALDGSALRNKVIANNIANADTPNFKRSEVLFEEQLRRLMAEPHVSTPLKVTNPRHIQVTKTKETFKPEIYQLNDMSYRNDNNNVDIDVETAKMSKNYLFYDALSTSMTQEIRLLRLAITGRS